MTDNVEPLVFITLVICLLCMLLGFCIGDHLAEKRMWSDALERGYAETVAKDGMIEFKWVAPEK